MPATQKSSVCLLCLSLALVCLLGVFAMIDASSANASQNEVLPNTHLSPASIVVSPTQLVAELLADQLVTRTLWITNTGTSEVSFSLLEMSSNTLTVPSRPSSAPEPVVDAELLSQIEEHGTALAIISLREQPDLSPAYLIQDKDARVGYVYAQLLGVASHSQELYTWLESQATQPSRLWIGNVIAARLNIAQLNTLVTHPQVLHISANHIRHIIPAEPSSLFLPQPALPDPLPGVVEWNIAKIRADQAWTELGVTGEGAVVGIIDTGVQYDHPALLNSYRGTLGGGDFDHNYNWFDFVSGGDAPYDDLGHGTWGAGIVTGDDGGINQIGVAPGSDWVAVKACTAGGSCSDFALTSSLQWMLAPTDLNGSNPDPSKAPDVILGMWGGSGCDTTFEFPLQALRAAGILPIFSPGAGGPTCGSIGSPADLPIVLAAGATDQDDLIAPFSGLGPSCYAQIKPDLTAPGVEIRTSALDGDYFVTSGTSWSAAHTAGAAAMVISANPMLSTEEVIDILDTTAVCINNPTCGGEPCPGANNVYGHGRIDVYEAVSAALALTDPLPWLAESPTSGSLAPGEAISTEVTFDSTGLAEGDYTGLLRILSDDPDTPLLTLPVTLTVVPACQPVVNLDIAYTPEKPIVGELVTFTATASGSQPIQYAWEFDGSFPAFGPEVTFTFEDPGSHLALLTANNDCSAGITKQLDLSVYLHTWLPIIR